MGQFIGQFTSFMKYQPTISCLRQESIGFVRTSSRFLKSTLLVCPMFSMILFTGFMMVDSGEVSQPVMLAKHTLNLNNRYAVSSVNEVMRDNILLTLVYMKDGTLTSADAQKLIHTPFTMEVRLQRGEVFAFHDKVLPQYKTSVVATTHAHFDAREGFKSDGYLFGDGVCHLASLMNQAALEAGLIVHAPTSHDFAVIPDVPRAYGVSIFTSADYNVSAKQNLYITNPFSEDIDMIVRVQNQEVTIEIKKNQPEAISADHLPQINI